MNFELLYKEGEMYRPALLLNDTISARARLLCGWIFSLCTIGSFLAVGLTLIVVAPLVDMALALLCFSLVGLIFFESIEAFYNSYYFKDVRKILSDSRDQKPRVSFMVADLVFHADPQNFSHDIFSSRLVGILMMRLGINAEEHAQFLFSHATRLDTAQFTIPDNDSLIDLPDLMQALFAADAGFSKFLFLQP